MSVEEAFRISVRDLVAFSCFPADITPSADMQAMLAGAQAHRARQSTTDGEAEKSIQWTFECCGEKVLVHGRMDVLHDDAVPLIEEIKHSFVPPDEPLREHRLQAVCYAAMLALQKPCSVVRISVCYVNEDGSVLRSFEEVLSSDALCSEMQAMLVPYTAWAIRERDHHRQRDESLKQLPFPFAAYRKGQRELAVQVYTAITRKKRLFASLPTGTGKSVAVLYPALKALGERKTERVVYLTARNTARQSPLNAIARMQQSGMHARCCVLTAREKLCPSLTRCHPDHCSRAKGHFLRQSQAINELLASGELLWDERCIQSFADKHELCPFEFALSLSELADVLMMDLNYAFDPFAQLKRLFQGKKRFTLLVDEAHHTVDRVRDNLSGVLDSRELARLRTEQGKLHGRKNALYRAMSALITALRALDDENERIEKVPQEVPLLVQRLMDENIRAVAEGNGGSVEILRICLPFLYAYEHLSEDYAILLEKQGKERCLTLYCLLPAAEIARITKGLCGTVFFSATLDPLPAMKRLLGGGDDDACFSLPSPFPPEHLQVKRVNVDTRFQQREHSAAAIARAIHDMCRHTDGNAIAFFPSYAYLELVKSHLKSEELPALWIQTRDMDENSRAQFMHTFDQEEMPVLGLCVLGGLFSEGVDLPGKRLAAAAIVGVGLPVPSARINAIRACYQQHFGDGFGYACRIPGMQKALQAAGRVIRSEHDRGMVVLLDERYFQQEYAALLPPHWQLERS